MFVKFAQDKQKCIYWSNKAKSRSIDVDKLKQITYKLNIQAVDGQEYLGSAVALSKDGKLVTAYHNVDSVKNIVATDYKGNEHNATLGKISVNNDLAYIYIEVNDIPFAQLSSKEEKLADEVYILNAKHRLNKGMLSKIDKHGVVLNIEITKGTSGAGYLI